MIADLRKLWQEAFGDSDDTLDAFFSIAFSPDRYYCILENGIPVSALYWFDCSLGEDKLAYIYAVATLQSHRGRGLARRLMEETHAILKSKGYAGAILVPGTEALFSFYEKIGYRTATTVTEFSCVPEDAAAKTVPIAHTEYARLRKDYLPVGSVIQEGETLRFLEAQGQFFKGDDFLLAGSIDGDVFVAQELLGNAQAAPAILRALHIQKGRFRTPGEGRPFAMYLPLREDSSKPAYFGLALD